MQFHLVPAITERASAFSRRNVLQEPNRKYCHWVGAGFVMTSCFA